MPEKKYNHIIPKCLLKQWNTLGEKYAGVHVYDITQKEFHFSSANGKRAYSFAGENDFYVPKINNKRYLNIENFFGEGEDTLARVISRITSNTKEDFLRDRLTFDKFLKALLSLKFRTKWHLTNIKNHLLDNSIQKELLDNNPEKDINLIVLESMIDTINEEYLSYEHCEIIVWFNKEGNFMTGDEPFIGGDYIVENGHFSPSFLYNFIALSPHHMITFRRANNKTILKFGDYNEELTASFNNTVAEESRYWIIAKTKENLLRYVDLAAMAKPKVDLLLKKTVFLKSPFKISN